MTEIMTARKNEKVRHLRALGADKAYRDGCGEIVCDGEKMLAEAIANGARLTCALYCGEKPKALCGAACAHETTREIIEYVSSVKSPQNVIFSCVPREREVGLCPDECCIILENVQDPGNVGTVIRTANAFSMDAVVLVGACADPFNPKTVRSTMGAVFRQKIIRVGYEELEAAVAAGFTVYGTALAPDSVDMRKTPLGGVSVAIGSEGRGLSERMLSLCAKKVIIPMNAECESLNAAVAASVMMWEMKRGEEF